MEEGFGPWKGLTLWKGWWSVGRAGAPFLEPISAGDAKFKAVVGEKEEEGAVTIKGHRRLQCSCVGFVQLCAVCLFLIAPMPFSVLASFLALQVL